MSNQVNDQLFERAREVSEAYVGTWLPTAIDNLIEKNELERLEYMVTQAEADLAREDFHNSDALPERLQSDTY